MRMVCRFTAVTEGVRDHHLTPNILLDEGHARRSQARTEQPHDVGMVYALVMKSHSTISIYQGCQQHFRTTVS